MLDILFVDDEPPIREFVRNALSEQGHRVTLAADGAQAMAYLDGQVFDVVISDVRLPKVDGFTILRRLRREMPSTYVILVTAYGTIADAVLAMREKAFNYLTKPFDLEELEQSVDRIEERQRLKMELAEARAQLSAVGAKTRLIGGSPAMQTLQERVEMIAQSDCPVLITGESGTGKELVARTLHERSPRKDKPFVAINCAAFPENLLEAELFGYERGAFTGALRRREGRFQAADGGTLLLDEIPEMPLASQAKLLRVLQEGTFEPIGTNATRTVDVRILSATNRDLKQLIDAGQFRADLSYRLNVFHLHVPPLRARRGDLPLLLEYFMTRLLKPGEPSPAFSPRAWAAISNYPFPGNVRELEHAVKHALVLARTGEIDLVHLPETLLGTSPAPSASDVPLRPLSSALTEFEREYILRVLQSVRGNRTRAAELLGISRKSLWQKLRGHGVTNPLKETESDRDGQNES